MNSTAIINIAKGQLGLDEDDYRALLVRVTGVSSLRKMSGGGAPMPPEIFDEVKREFGVKICHGLKNGEAG